MSLRTRRSLPGEAIPWLEMGLLRRAKTALLAAISDFVKAMWEVERRLPNPKLYDILAKLPPTGGSYYAPLKGKHHLTRLLTGAGVLAVGQNAILSYSKF